MVYASLNAVFVAFLVGRVAVRAIRRIAPKIDFVDRPDSRRKLQECPIPLGGGLAVWAALWCGWLAGIFSWSCIGIDVTEEVQPFAGLAVASMVTLILGMVDDRLGLRGAQKLTGQLAAAAVLVGSGLRVDGMEVLGFAVDFAGLAVPISVFWIVLVVNAFNLIDGMDGFCGALALVASVAITILSYASGRLEDALAGLAISGALLAFLKDNHPPARIYLGDAGSMTLGLMIAALSIRACSLGTARRVTLLPLIALVALPLLDVLTALCRRWLTGNSLFTPDRGHIHHRLRNRLGNVFAALGIAVGLAAVGAVGAVLSRVTHLGDGAACIALLAPVTLLVVTDTFGGSELRLLLLRVRPLLAGFMAGRSARGAVIRHECHLIGSRDWTGVWNALITDVEANDLRRVELAIQMPAAGETYHGFWTVSEDREGRPDWSLIYPIRVGGDQAGTLRLGGSVDPSGTRYLDRVEGVLRMLEGRIEEEMSRVFQKRSQGFGPAPALEEPVGQPRLGPTLL